MRRRPSSRGASWAFVMTGGQWTGRTQFVSAAGSQPSLPAGGGTALADTETVRLGDGEADTLTDFDGGTGLIETEALGTALADTDGLTQTEGVTDGASSWESSQATIERARPTAASRDRAKGVFLMP